MTTLQATTSAAKKKSTLEANMDNFARSFLGYTPYRCVCLRMKCARRAHGAVRMHACTSTLVYRQKLCCTSPECTTAPYVSNMMSDDKWGKDYLGGEDAAPGNKEGATGGGGYSFPCSVSESGEIQGCAYGASG
jgi:hypothetical protein